VDPFEKAIRSAFEKGNPSDRTFREKVYRSAFSALDRALQANPNATDEVVAQRRKGLSAKISEIESEFIPAVPMVEPASRQAAQASPSPVAPAVDEGRSRHDVSIDDEIEVPSYGKYAPKSRKRRPWMSMLLTVLVLALIGSGAWWALRPTPPAPATRANPPLEEESFAPSEPSSAPLREAIAGDELENWISVFEPGDASTVTAPGDSRAEIIDEDGEPVIRITTGASGSPILFDVGRGVLEQIAGTRAVFNIIARAEDGKDTQMSVECSLAELGDCGRKRYAVTSVREEFLFEIQLPATDPGAGGTIAIHTDMEGAGKSVEVYAIRVSSAQ
jgi:hypothetical protein